MTYVNETSISDFLGCATGNDWVVTALQNIDELLIDHANCEKKAASTAVALMFRYADRADLVYSMSRLAREELRHFEQVHKILQRRGIAYRRLAPSDYAAGLHRAVRCDDPQRLIDLLIIGAFIEARSCERFSLLAPHLDEELGRFYSGLLASEARHYQQYIALARQYASPDTDNGRDNCKIDGIDFRIGEIREIERELINKPSGSVRFHSGPVLSQTP